MALKHVLGSSSPVVTNTVYTKAEKFGATVTVEGRYSDLTSVVPVDYSPQQGLAFESSVLSGEFDGTGKLEIQFHDPGNDQLECTRETYRVDMEEVQYDLKDHEDLDGVETQKEIEAWLATDAAKRVDENGSFQYEDENGAMQPVGDANAQKFCKAYWNGIKTFVRFFPVIEKITTWKRPPGMTVDVNTGSVTGNPSFSSCGTFETPPISLAGYESTNFFKSKDSWTQGADQKWTRVEQWTYTPDGSSSEFAWIYGGGS